VSGSERRKGAGGELEVARIFQAAGFDCDRTPNSGGLRIRGDLHGDLPLHVEVKRQETARPWLWAEQARVDAGAGERWVVAMRRSRDEWVAMLPLVDLVRLLELERELHALRRRLPRCSGTTPSGFRCSQRIGHAGAHDHPQERV
jgi:Holliday junction resolvase